MPRQRPKKSRKNKRNNTGVIAGRYSKQQGKDYRDITTAVEKADRRLREENLRITDSWYE